MIWLGGSIELPQSPHPAHVMSNGQMADAQPVFRIEVRTRCEINQAAGRKHVDSAHLQGIRGLTDCQALKLYFASGSLSPNDVARLAQELLVDPVTEAMEIMDAVPEVSSFVQSVSPSHRIDVTLLPGVTDPAAENLLRAARLLGIEGIERAATGQCYLLWGDLSEDDLRRLSVDVFSNPVIQRCAVDHPIVPPFVPYQQTDDTVEVVRLQYADPDGLMAIGIERRLALDLDEMLAIQSYYQDEERDPTDAELEMLAQTWSEHCVHKTFKALIECQGHGTVNGLLHTYIRAATEEVNKPWVRSAFVDNAGIIAFDETHDLAFKVETHNHPSALGAVRRRQHGRGRRGARYPGRQRAAHRQHRRAVLRAGRHAGGRGARRRAAPAAHRRRRGARRRGLRQQDGHPHGERGRRVSPRLHRQPAGVLRLPGHPAARRAPGPPRAGRPDRRRRRAHRPRRPARGDLLQHGDGSRHRPGRRKRRADRAPHPREAGAGSRPARARREALPRHHRLRRRRPVVRRRRDGQAGRRAGATRDRPAEIPRAAALGNLAERGAGAHGAGRAAGEVDAAPRRSATARTSRRCASASSNRPSG